MKETKSHIYFWGGVYSQWFKSNFSELNLTFNTAESYMMYHKAMLFGSPEIAQQILNTSDPKKQKALGREVKTFDEETWNQHKLEIVVRGNMLKFSQDQNLKRELLSSGDKILVEGSPEDKIWGVGLRWDDPRILDQAQWRGQNLLGEALMRVRSQLRGMA